MRDYRIQNHPILPSLTEKEISFTWNGEKIKALAGEMISSALFANGIRTFGHHHKDQSAQGIFCANGQCARCTVLVEGEPQKACMTEVKENLQVESLKGLPEIPTETSSPVETAIKEYIIDTLIIGGGPSGLSAAIELEKLGIPTILVDDKNSLGGKLLLQTHKFFGSEEDSQAGTRGNDIAFNLADQVLNAEHIDVWTGSTAIFIFKDKKVGIYKQGTYCFVKPKVILICTGARENFLKFKGNTLPGIYGAGAFQTLVNRDLIKPTEKLFIIGGGNVGLIAGYHAIQAGIEVVGLVEAAPSCGGYKVHADKLIRLGVPIYTSHTILAAEGGDKVNSIVIAEIDKNFQAIPGTEQEFDCDTILIAVGLEPINEFAKQAEKAEIPFFAAGDALEIAEASSAMFNGKIAGLKVANHLGKGPGEIPATLYEKADILKSHPGKKRANPDIGEADSGVSPIIHCLQEIPCNPCSTVCPSNSIFMEGDPIMGFPTFKGECIGCGKCVQICPGLAITLVDTRKDQDMPILTLPYEVPNIPINKGDTISTVDVNGKKVGDFEVIKVTNVKKQKMQMIKIKVPAKLAPRIVSFTIQDEKVSKPTSLKPSLNSKQEQMVCLCERVKEDNVRELIKKGVTDINQIKALTRAGMGACGSKTCDRLIKQVLRSENIPMDSITPNTNRPTFVEVPLGAFAGEKLGGKDE